MFDSVIVISLTIISLAMIGMIYRVIKGPTVADRVVALDAVGISLVAIIALVSIILKTNAFLDIILLIGILAFIGTVASLYYILNNQRCSWTQARFWQSPACALSPRHSPCPCPAVFAPAPRRMGGAGK